MKKTFQKQVIIGIIGMLVSAGAFVSTMGFLNTDYNIKWLVYTVIAVFAAMFFGFLLYIFGGKEMFIWGVKFGLGFIAFNVSIHELPQPFSGILIVVLVVIFLALPNIKEYCTVKISSSEKPQKKLDKEIELSRQLAEAEKEIDDVIRFGEKSLLLFAPMGGIYQVINGKDTFYCIRVGGELAGIDQELLITDFSDESMFIKNKKDFPIIKSNITTVSINQKHSANCPFPQCGKVSISTVTGKKNFVIIGSVGSEKIIEFFGTGVNPSGIKLGISHPVLPEKPLSGNDRLILPQLRQICLVLNVLAIISFAVFLFVDFNYKLMSAICILIPITILIVYFRYNNILSFEDEKNGKTYSKNKINMSLPLILPSMGLGLRSIMDFNFTEFGNLIFWSVLIFVVVLLSFFLFTTEYKIKKSAALTLVISMLFYAPSTTAQVNYLLDFSKPVISSSLVIDKYIDEGSKGPDIYKFIVNLENGKQCDIMVSKTYYEKIKRGQTVQINENAGFLKIKYASVFEE